VRDDISASDTKAHSKEPGYLFERCSDESSLVLSVSDGISLAAVRGFQLDGERGLELDCKAI